ncbi:MAG: hypothetical protein ABL998_10670 [Planctomycetota bacterium]
MTLERAPVRLVDWWRGYRKSHATFPFEISYHPRSDEHSKILCAYVLEDLVATCGSLRRDALNGDVCYDVNHEVFRQDGTKKVLDLVIGQPERPLTGVGIRKGTVATPGIRIALEAKAAMTKHVSAIPRLRDELTGSMRSAVEANPHAVTCGITVVNIASSFLSPTDQKDPLPTETSALRRRTHRQPTDAERVIEMLERLPIRHDPPDVGFDAMGIIVVSHDNELPDPGVTLIEDSPSPVRASPRNYNSFLIEVCNKYTRRFGRT